MVDQVLALSEGTRLMLLAPVVRDRKGEHHNQLAELRAQGFVRARIDNEVFELDDPPDLDLHRKHTVEAVVDRVRVREDLRLRLAESLETALRLADGIAQVAFMDEPGREELLFSDRFACPVCGYSIPELEPRMFSFNNPAGACKTCDGLGVQQFFDPERVAASPHLSLAGGAIRGWDRRNAYYFQLIQCLARHFKFDIEQPFAELPEKLRQIILYGSGDEVIEFSYLDGRGGSTKRRHRFEGIIPNMERRYRETESNTVREELAKYLSMRPCGDCAGTRLNEGARHVFVNERSLPELTSLSVGAAGRFFGELDLPGWRGEIAGKIVKEIGDRLQLSGRCRAGLPVAGPQRGDLVGRRGAAYPSGQPDRLRTGRRHVHPRRAVDRPASARQSAPAQHADQLRDLGNTVIVVEHDEEAIAAADYVLDIGPGPASTAGRSSPRARRPTSWQIRRR